MTDNTAVTNGTGDVYRSVDRTGVKTDVVMVDTNAGGTEALLSPTNPMPTAEQKSATATESGVAASATSVTILASNTARKGATVCNDAASSALHLRLSATAATAASGGYTVALLAGGYYEVPFGYTGQIVGIWDTATGFANVTELS
jgi:hypothetical protein